MLAVTAGLNTYSGYASTQIPIGTAVVFTHQCGRVGSRLYASGAALLLVGVVLRVSGRGR